MFLQDSNFAHKIKIEHLNTHFDRCKRFSTCWCIFQIFSGDPEAMTVMVNARCGNGNQFLRFKLKVYTPLHKLMLAYCDRTVCFWLHFVFFFRFMKGWMRTYKHDCVNQQKLELAKTSFLFHGNILLPIDTPSSWKMEDGDIIEVFQHQDIGQNRSENIGPH